MLDGAVVAVDNERMVRQARSYTVSDGVLVLTLERAEEGGFVVTSPMDPALITEAETLEEAFEAAHDAMATLSQGRAKLRPDSMAG